MGKAVGNAGERNNGYFALTGEISLGIICILLTTFSVPVSGFLPIHTKVASWSAVGLIIINDP